MTTIGRIALTTCLVASAFAIACGNEATQNVFAGSGGDVSAVAGASGVSGAANPVAGQGAGGVVATAGNTTAKGGNVALAGKGGAKGTAGKGGKKATGGSGGKGATDQSGTAGKGAAGSQAEPEDLGKGDGTDVITIGDSWMNIVTNGMGIEGALDRAGTSYRHYGVAGTRLLDEVIPNQYERAKRENPNIKTVIMTAGGNDILLNGINPCTTPPASAACIERLDAIAKRCVELWTEMANDGVQDVIYIQYSRGGLTNAPGVDYANTEGIINDCKKTPICNYIDSDTLMNEELMVDGIHPTTNSCDKLATGIVDLMEKEGMRR